MTIECFISDSNNSAGRYSAQQRDMLLSLPGISSKNVNFLLDGFNNMNEVRDPRIIWNFGLDHWKSWTDSGRTVSGSGGL